MIQTVYTYGYIGTKPETLKAHVERLGAMLVDIRYAPYSRAPQWCKDALKALVGEANYLWVGQFGNVNHQVGGKIVLSAPEHGLERLLPILEQRPVILLCACRDWRTCHRTHAAEYIHRHIGCEVEHLDGTWVERDGMTTLTLTQPWASMIEAVALGLPGKRIETRSWSTPYRGPLAIHAAKGLAGMQKGVWEDLCQGIPFREILLEMGYVNGEGQVNPDAIPRGAIVAVADLVDVVPVEQVKPGELERSFGNYTPGRYAWLLENTRRVDPPVQAKGKQGLWNHTGALLCSTIQNKEQS
jgi:hypothetical protein